MTGDSVRGRPYSVTIKVYHSTGSLTPSANDKCSFSSSIIWASKVMFKKLSVLLIGLIFVSPQSQALDLQKKDGTALKEVLVTREQNGWFKIKHSSGLGRYHVSEFVPETQEQLIPRKPEAQKPSLPVIQQTEVSLIEAVPPAPPESSVQAVETPPPALNLLVDTLKTMSEKVLQDLQVKGITRLAVSKVYFNGSGVNPVAQYVQRKLLGEILNGAPEGLDILEREDIRLLVKENQLQWMIGSGTENVADESQALLMGEFLYDNAFRQALLSLRVIDSQSAEIISAVTSVIDVDADLSGRLGIPFNALSTTPLYTMQSSITDDSRFMDKINGIGSLSLSPVSAVPQKYQFAVRVFYGFAITELVNSGVPILERELLYQIAEERALVEKSLDSVAVGGGIIQTIVDESSADNAPTFFIKAVRRDGGSLLAQVEVELKTSQESMIRANKATSGVSPLGADDSLTSAVRAYNDAALVERPDALRFQEVFVMSDKMVLSDDKARLLNGADIPVWHYENGLIMVWTRLQDTPSESVDGRQMFDYFLEKLIPRENGNIEALKASLVALSVGGCRLPEYKHFIGPLNLVYIQLSSNYTIYNNRKPSKGYNSYWYACFEAFSKTLYESMHPLLSRKIQNPIDPYRGTFRWKMSNWPTAPEAIFDYTIETTWQGKYPAVTTVTLDFSPMKDNLYKVKSIEE